MLDQEIIHVRDMEAEPGILESIRALGHRSQLSVPMPRDGKAPGVIILAANEPGGFSDSQVELLKTFAEQAVIAITSAETYRALRERTAALAQRNSEFGERIEQQSATIDVMKVMSGSPDDAQPVFDLIAIRPRITRKSSPGIEAIQRRRLGKSAEHRHALSAGIRSPE